MDDLISRRAVLALARDLTFEGMDELKYYKYRCIDPNDVQELPSVQPEVIRCKDCKHSFLHDNGEKISRICGLTRMCGTTPDNWFCADAERGKV